MNAPFSCRRGGEAFTVLELLVVISLVAVLLFLGFSAISGMRAGGSASKCTANLRQVAAAAITYAGDHKGALPPYNHKGKYWYLYLMHSDLVGRIEGRGILPNENPQHSRNVKTVYHCPTNDGRIQQYSTPNYAYNRALGDSLISMVESPGITVMFVDAGYRNGSAAQFYGNIQPELYPEKVCCYITDYVSASFPWDRSVNFDLHNGRANVAFADGHVEALSKEVVRQRAEALRMLWGRENKPINSDQSPYFWSSAVDRAN